MISDNKLNLISTLKGSRLPGKINNKLRINVNFHANLVFEKDNFNFFNVTPEQITAVTYNFYKIFI